MGAVAIFVLSFWVERNDSQEWIMAELMGECPILGCGGRLPALVCVGRIEGDRYLVKNPAALYQDTEFPLPRALVCTNCRNSMEVPQAISESISMEAEKFVKGLKEARRASKTSLN